MIEQIAVRKILQEHFAESSVKNPSFSIRAFSKRLGVSPATVSQVLAGKRQISKKMMKRMLDGLLIAPHVQNDILSDTKEEKSEISADAFHLIADWYHLAILSQLEVAGTQGKASWISRRLNISEKTTEQALMRLERLKLVKKGAHGLYRLTISQNLKTTDGISDLAIKKNHTQVLELAKRSVMETAMEKTDFTNTVMAIDPKKLKDAKVLIRDFKRKLSSFLENGDKKEVYFLAVQLFPGKIGE